MNYSLLLCLAILGTCARAEESNESTNRIPWRPAPADMVAPAGLPEMGKWMFDARNRPAQWLGERYQGRNLREPINLIIVDNVAPSAEEARERLFRNFKEVGFLVREGHSAGYQGYIAGRLYAQIPDGGKVAFSDKPFEFGNNHGRFFGPHPFQGGWLFIGAVSRERIEPLQKIKHRYVSFNRARDTLAQRLDLMTSYKIAAFSCLSNAVNGDGKISTGDHDTIAVLLRTIPTDSVTVPPRKERPQ
jgi:hypothetical protein